MNKSKKLVYSLLTVVQIIGVLLLIVWPIMVIVMLVKGSTLGVVLMLLLGGMPGFICRFAPLGYKNGHCSKCGNSFAGCSYEYYADSKKIDNNGNEHVKVIINAECPCCGKVKKIKMRYCTYDAKKDVIYDLQSKVDETCMRFFKH